MRWEYKVLATDRYHDQISKLRSQLWKSNGGDNDTAGAEATDVVLTPILQKLGSDGWELVTTVSGGSGTLYFKRPVAGDP